MEMKNMMNVIGSVWETLDKMHHENPDKYQVTSFISLYSLHKRVTFAFKDIVKQSMKYHKGTTSKPEPFKCIEASTEVGFVARCWKIMF